MTKSKTFKQVAAELTENQIGIKRVAGEYRVWPKAENCGGLGTYFTDDLHDAHMTGLSMAKDAGTLVTRVERTSLANAVEYHAQPAITVSDVTDFTGKGVIRIGGVGTFTAKANAYGNWYGYQGRTRVTMFFGDYVDQMFEAAKWLRTLEQAAALKGSR